MKNAGGNTPGRTPKEPPDPQTPSSSLTPPPPPHQFCLSRLHSKLWKKNEFGKKKKKERNPAYPLSSLPFTHLPSILLLFLPPSSPPRFLPSPLLPVLLTNPSPSPPSRPFTEAPYHYLKTNSAVELSHRKKEGDKSNHFEALAKYHWRRVYYTVGCLQDRERTTGRFIES